MTSTAAPAPAATDTTLALLTGIVRALDEKKAENLRVLHVTAQSSITDYLVLASGNSEPHLRALRIELEKVLDAAHAPIAGMDTGDYQAGWTVVDAYQIMVHVFTPEKRDTYRLEQLWADAEPIAVRDLLAPPPAPAAVAPKKKAAVRKPAPRKATVKKAAKKAATKKAARKAAKKAVVKKTVAKKAAKKSARPAG